MMTRLLHIRASPNRIATACGSWGVSVYGERAFSMGAEGFERCSRCAAWTQEMLDAADEAQSWDWMNDESVARIAAALEAQP